MSTYLIKSYIYAFFLFQLSKINIQKPTNNHYSCPPAPLADTLTLPIMANHCLNTTITPSPPKKSRTNLKDLHRYTHVILASPNLSLVIKYEQQLTTTIATSNRFLYQATIFFFFFKDLLHQRQYVFCCLVLKQHFGWFSTSNTNHTHTHKAKRKLKSNFMPCVNLIS